MGGAAQHPRPPEKPHHLQLLASIVCIQPPAVLPHAVLLQWMSTPSRISHCHVQGQLGAQVRSCPACSNAKRTNQYKLHHTTLTWSQACCSLETIPAYIVSHPSKPNLLRTVGNSLSWGKAKFKGALSNLICHAQRYLIPYLLIGFRHMPRTPVGDMHIVPLIHVFSDSCG